MRIDPGQNLDKGRFARAILTNQRMNLTLTKIEVDAVQGSDTRKGLGDAFHLEQGRKHLQKPRSARKSFTLQPKSIANCKLKIEKCKLQITSVLEKATQSDNRFSETIFQFAFFNFQFAMLLLFWPLLLRHILINVF